MGPGVGQATARVRSRMDQVPVGPCIQLGLSPAAPLVPADGPALARLAQVLVRALALARLAQVPGQVP
jgi:hypothetical protein